MGKLIKIYDAFVRLLVCVRVDRIYHFLVGMIIAGIFGISLRMGVWAFVPSLFAGFFKEFIDKWQDGNFDGWDLLATALGGVFISLCFLLQIAA